MISCTVCVDRKSVSHGESIHHASGDSSTIVTVLSHDHNVMNHTERLAVLTPQHDLGIAGKIERAEHCKPRVFILYCAECRTLGLWNDTCVGGKRVHFCIAHFLCRRHCLVKEPVCLSLYRTCRIREIRMIRLSGPVLTPGHKCRSCEIFQPRTFIKSDSRFEKFNGIRVDTGLGCRSSLEQIVSLVKIRKDKSCHFIARGTFACLYKLRLVVSKGMLYNRIVAVCLEMRKILIGAEEIHLADVTLDIVCIACDSVCLVFRQHLVKEIIDRVDVHECPVAVVKRCLPVARNVFAVIIE